MRRLAVVVATVFATACTSAPTGRDVLMAAADSMAAVNSVLYEYTYSGSGSAAGEYSGTVRLIARRGAPLYWAELRPSPTWDPIITPIADGARPPALTLASGGEHVAAKDAATGRFWLGTRSGGSAHLVAAAPLAVLFEFAERDPFAEELAGELTLEPQESIAGVMCNVVRGTSEAFGPADVWWYIGAEDGLPRAYRWVSRQPDAPGELLLALGSLDTSRELSLQALDLAQSATDELIEEDTRRVEPGVPAPSWAAATSGGDVVRSEELSGSVVVLAFWASWCAPCRPMLTELDRLADTFEGQGVRFLTLATWDEASVQPDSVLTSYGVSLPALVRGERLEVDYRLTELPALFVIDRNGQLVHVSNPVAGDAATEAAELEASIRGALGR